MARQTVNTPEVIRASTTDLPKVKTKTCSPSARTAVANNPLEARGMKGSVPGGIVRVYESLGNAASYERASVFGSETLENKSVMVTSH